MLFWAGARLIVSDIDEEKCRMVSQSITGAQIVPPAEIMKVECDVLAPCAMGGTINEQTIPTLKCKAIAGCANNQLLKDTDADELLARGILYAPDFVINAGGLINVTQELDVDGYNPVTSRNKVHRLYDQLHGDLRHRRAQPVFHPQSCALFGRLPPEVPHWQTD